MNSGIIFSHSSFNSQHVTAFECNWTGEHPNWIRQVVRQYGCLHALQSVWHRRCGDAVVLRQKRCSAEGRRIWPTSNPVHHVWSFVVIVEEWSALIGMAGKQTAYIYDFIGDIIAYMTSLKAITNHIHDVIGKSPPTSRFAGSNMTIVWEKEPPYDTLCWL